MKIVKDGDSNICAMADRHYSRKTIGANRIAGPGEHIILTNDKREYVIGFRKQLYRLDNQIGIECFIFRNEGSELSSDLLITAENFIVGKWGQGIRVFTFVNPAKIKSHNPGFCFKKAGYKIDGKNKKGNLIVLSKTILV